MEHEALPPFFYEIFDASLPRLGPGDGDSTARALDVALAGRPDGPVRILDLGCGNGAQTLRLAELTDGPIIAVDNHRPYLDELRRRTAKAGCLERIRIEQGDMANPDPGWGPADLIWSEGAIFVPGVEGALRSWRPLLSAGGRMAFTELCWFASDPPDECANYFAKTYPPMAPVPDIVAVAERCGYAVLEHFPVPESGWRENFYLPLAAWAKALKSERDLGEDEMKLLEAIELEIDIFKRFLGHFGYEFFILEPVSTSPPGGTKISQ